jgi:hypothetical protein
MTQYAVLRVVPVVHSQAIEEIASDVGQSVKGGYEEWKTALNASKLIEDAPSVHYSKEYQNYISVCKLNDLRSGYDGATR